MNEIYALDLDWDFVQHLADPESFTIIRDERVSPVILEDETSKSIYEWALEYYRNFKKAPTAAIVEKEWDIEIRAPETAVRYCIQELRRRYWENEKRNIIMPLAKVEAAEAVPEMMKQARKLKDIITERGEEFSQDSLDRTLDDYHRRVLAGAGPSFGFKEVDDQYYGQLGLTFLVGSPKSGKSWFTIRALEENIMNGTQPFLYSLELPAKETNARLISMKSKVPFSKYLRGGLDPSDIQAYNESAEIIKDLGGSYTISKPDQGHRGVHEMVERAKEAGAGCIFIDQLQYVENRSGVSIGATNDTKDFFEVINDFRDMSDDIPIFIVHQFNRSIMNAESMPEIQQIKSSAAVEECATLVLGLWADKAMKQSNLVQLGALASRNYALKAWQCQVQLRTNCRIQIVGEVDEN